MRNSMMTLRKQIRSNSPLIHCITNPISINDCANIILAVGAKPIMAEHPREVRQITGGADALLLNLGNITDVRMKSMPLAAEAAREKGIPIVLDLVGVACSDMRLSFAAELTERYHPQIIKGNRSELAALWEGRLTARGVDADGVVPASEVLAVKARKMAKRWNATVLLTGPADVISTEERTLLCRNGHPMLGELTGTGCMLGALTATYASGGDPFVGAVLAAVIEGVAGEAAAETAKGIGSFRAEFFDALYSMSDDELMCCAQWEELQ